MAGRFEAELRRHNLKLHPQALAPGRKSWEFFLTNLFLYSEYMPSCVSTTADQLAQLCAQFGLQPAEVFRHDWRCMYNKSTLLEELGEVNYYSHPIYVSHLWVENISARRLLFSYSIRTAMKAAGLAEADSRILDVGSGMGGSLRLFPAARERVGIDSSEPMVCWCNATSQERERYQLMDCRAIDYPENTFDVVFSFDVLEHIDETRNILREIQRVTQPQGVVAIIYPFGAYDWDSHISLVEKPEFDGWLKSAGYSILEEVQPSGEVFPCTVCYLLRPS
jgi:2-polyprenyl-3-methyl-5-hydroxy-6-metoxy-1,4-benzoquinol methylase